MKFFQTLAEGGQTWAHRVRMVRQVFKIALAFALLSMLSYAVYSFSRLNPLLPQSAYYYLKADMCSYMSLKQTTVNVSFWEKLSHERVRAKEKIISVAVLKRLTQPQIRLLYDQGKDIIQNAFSIGMVAFWTLLLFFLVRGSTSKRKRHISGKKRIHPFLLKLLLLIRRKASDLHIGSLPLVKNSETQHILVTGGTGSGKTNCFHHLLPQVRFRGQKGVVIDTSGVFVEKYYDPAKDVILNPFDPRGSPWNPWIECEDCFDYDNLAESMIPHTHNDHENYWRTAARTVFSTLMLKLSNTKNTTELIHWLLFKSLSDLSEFVQDTKAAAHIDINSEKTAASIRSVAASFLNCLEYLPDTQHPFSIKKWVQNENPDSWLFLCAKPSQRTTLNPLISCWFSTAVRSLIQMDSDLNRRIWFIIDELPSIQKLKELEMLITESRKYGGCGLLALQSISQLEEIYGRSGTHTIVGNCATRIIFADHDPKIADLISKSLGENEIKEYQEGISYGAHEVRDGVSLSLQTKKVPVVSVTDIQSLENNQAFIKLPGNIPITKIYLKFK